MKQLLGAATVPVHQREVCDAAQCCNEEANPTWVL